MFRKLGSKIFKDKRHVGITLYPTSQCDTGCLHCIDNCNMKNPENFTGELADMIVKEARQQRWKLSVLFTGGGESLLTPEFLEIADVFGNYERRGIMTLITSGFKDDETFRRHQFEAILRRPYGKDLIIEQSFSLYQPSFSERLANCIRLLMEIRKKTAFYVRACMSLDNCRQTQWKIENLLKKLSKEIGAAYHPVPIGWHEEDRRFFHLFESKLIGDETAYRLGVEAFLSTQWHAIKTGEHEGVVVIVQPIPLEQSGRGAAIKEGTFGRILCHTHLMHQEDTYLIVGPDGSVYPECTCYPTKNMRLGKIGEDSLVELIRRKDVFAERITRAILADNRMCEWGTGEVCTLCKQIVAEKGIELK